MRNRAPRWAAALCSSMLGFSVLATAAAAQPPFPPDPLGQAQPAPAPPPAPDPAAWWSAPELRNDLLDPLGNRRPGRGPPATIAAPVDASVYRLWGLMPLQTQVLRRDETVFETWVRPVDASRQAVVRVVLRTDGRVFVQARAGVGCCGPGVGRRVDIDRELPRESAAAFKALKADALWTQPEHVLVQEDGAVSALCVDGIAYDLMRVEARRATHLRRSCDPAEVGSVATALRTILGAAQGFDPRFDAAFEDGFGFANEATEYAKLGQRGGGLAARRANSASAEIVTPPPPDAGAEPDEDDPRTEVLEVDRAFAARAGQVGSAAAFREFMDAVDGRLIPRTGPIAVGGDAIFALMGGTAPEGGRLLWEPKEAFVAESGDLATTWGEARFVSSNPEQGERTGRYVTVWRKDEDGRWRGLIDLGNMPTASPAPATASTPPAPAR